MNYKIKKKVFSWSPCFIPYLHVESKKKFGQTLCEAVIEHADQGVEGEALRCYL